MPVHTTSRTTPVASRPGADEIQTETSFGVLRRLRDTNRTVTGLERTTPPNTSPAADRAERAAVLRALYDDRGELIDLEALGRLTEADRVRLSDLEREIDKWEKPEKAPASDDIWEELERMAHETLAFQARIEDKKRR